MSSLGPSRPSGRRGRLRRSLVAVSAYTFLGWAYVAANSVTHPDTLGLHLTHFARWPAEGTFGAWCFILSAGCFLAAQLVGVSRSTGLKPGPPDTDIRTMDSPCARTVDGLVIAPAAGGGARR